ncbi:l-asparaginase [Trichonephila clavipes]|nr:l-asparaginase [Trichonephila clavipes]
MRTWEVERGQFYDLARFLCQVRAFLSPPIEGVVLQTYGAGNGPSQRKDLFDELKRANRRGVIIVNCTQCSLGQVDPSYETGRALVDVGVVPGSDMTLEAALTKLSYVLSKKEWTIQTKRNQSSTLLKFVGKQTYLSMGPYLLTNHTTQKLAEGTKSSGMIRGIRLDHLYSDILIS